MVIPNLGIETSEESNQLKHRNTDGGPADNDLMDESLMDESIFDAYLVFRILCASTHIRSVPTCYGEDTH